MKALIVGASLALSNVASAMIAPAAVPPLAADVRSVQKALETKILRQRLSELGISDQEIRTRLKKLSDQQIHQLALRA